MVFEDNNNGAAQTMLAKYNFIVKNMILDHRSALDNIQFPYKICSRAQLNHYMKQLRLST